MKKEFTEIIHTYLKKNDLQSVFKFIDKNIKSKSGKYNEFVNTNARYNDNKTSFLGNIIKYEDYLQENSKIRISILSLINSIEKKDLKKNISNLNTVLKQPSILVLSATEDNEEYMKEFFSLLDYKNVTVENINIQRTYENIDIIIFDNRDLKDCFKKENLEDIEERESKLIQSRIQRMEDIIKKGNEFFIHFGGRLYWINSQRDRFHSANYKFSLHARLSEMIDFINRYKT